MSIHRPGEPWPEATYRGFSGPDPVGDRLPRRRRLAPLSRNRLMIGAAAAVALGLILGVWARPRLDAGGSASPAEAAAAGPAVPIEVARPAPPPQPKSAGKLEVLPPGVAEAARAQAAPARPPILAPAPPIPAEPQPAPVASPPRAAEWPAPTARASFDCASARPGAEQIICSDPALASEDRTLARAYRRALASGAAPPGALRAEQRDWMAIREDAARRSRRALADVYRQRIEELNSLAAEGEGSPDDDGPGL